MYPQTGPRHTCPSPVPSNSHTRPLTSSRVTGTRDLGGTIHTRLGGSRGTLGDEYSGGRGSPLGVYAELSPDPFVSGTTFPLLDWVGT